MLIPIMQQKGALAIKHVHICTGILHVQHSIVYFNLETHSFYTQALCWELVYMYSHSGTKMQERWVKEITVMKKDTYIHTCFCNLGNAICLTPDKSKVGLWFNTMLLNGVALLSRHIKSSTAASTNLMCFWAASLLDTRILYIACAT